MIVAPSPRPPALVPAVLTVAAGGALGALARYGLAAAVPPRPGLLPWSTLWTNLSGCLLIGVVAAVLDRAGRHRELPRLFLTTGVLGGYTTFSGYTAEAWGLAVAGRPWLAAGYLVGTLVAAVAAAWLGEALGARWWRR